MPNYFLHESNLTSKNEEILKKCCSKYPLWIVSGFFWAILQLQDDMMLVMCQNPSYANQRNEPKRGLKKKTSPRLKLSFRHRLSCLP